MEGNRKKKKMKTMMMEMEKSEEEGEYGGIGYLPSDVLIEVLSRLGVKCLSRFKCVSKSWLNLIKDESFVQLQLNRSIENITGRFLRVCAGDYQQVTKVRFYDGKAKGQGEEENVLVGKVISFRFPSIPPSCNGLICYMNPNYHIQVCNPITRETITLPNPNFIANKRVKNLQDLNLTVVLGIGYVSSEKKYKVVVAWSNLEDSDVEIITLGGSSSSLSWRPVSSKRYGSLLSDAFGQFVAPVYTDGVLYWYLTQGYCESYEYVWRYQRYLVSFDFAQEKFNLIPAPKTIDRGNSTCWLFNLAEHLCLLESHPLYPTKKMWLLKHHDWVSCKLPPFIYWVSTWRSNNQHGYFSLVSQCKGRGTTLVRHDFDHKFQLIKPGQLHASLPNFLLTTVCNSIYKYMLLECQSISVPLISPL